MKKILAGIVLGIILMGLVGFAAAVDIPSPGGTLGQPNECCKIKHNIAGIGGESRVAEGSVIGPSATAYCAIDTVNVERSTWAGYCLIDSVITVSEWIFWIALVIAGIVLVIGGIMFMTAAGSPERQGSAKAMLTFGIIGIVIAILARFIPGIARFFLGM